MPYLSKNKYANWLYYIKQIIAKINEFNMCDLTGEPEYYIGLDTRAIKSVLLKMTAFMLKVCIK